MTEEELDEALEYNLEYLEARLDEDLFGGDYTSAVELRHVNDELERTIERIYNLFIIYNLLFISKLTGFNNGLPKEHDFSHRKGI